jgi:hypothetical protein
MPDVDSTYDQVYHVLALLVLPKSRRLAKLGIMACGGSLQAAKHTMSSVSTVPWSVGVCNNKHRLKVDYGQHKDAGNELLR